MTCVSLPEEWTLASQIKWDGALLVDDKIQNKLLKKLLLLMSDSRDFVQLKTMCYFKSANQILMFLSKKGISRSGVLESQCFHVMKVKILGKNTQFITIWKVTKI